MGFQFVSAPFVETEALACPFAVARVGADDIQQTLEATEKLRRLVGQTDEDIRLIQFARIGADQNGRVPGEWVAATHMWQEGQLLRGPERRVQFPRQGIVAGIDQHILAGVEGLGRQLARYLGLGWSVVIEVDASHVVCAC